MATSPFASGIVPGTPVPAIWRPVSGPVPLTGPGIGAGQPAFFPAPMSRAYTPVLTYVPRLVSAPQGQAPADAPGGDVLALSNTQPAGSAQASQVAPNEAIPANAAAPATADTQATLTGGPDAEATASKRVAEPIELTRGQQIGQQVGKFLDENPAILTEVEKLDPERLMSDPNSFANDFKTQFQRSRTFRLLQRMGLERRIAGLFPADMEPAVLKFFEWLNTPVEGKSPSASSDPFGDMLTEEAPKKKKGRLSRREKTFEEPLADPGSLAAAAV